MADNTDITAEGLAEDRLLLDRLRWFVRVRRAAGVFCAALLVLCHHGLGVRFRFDDGVASYVPALLAVTFMIACNVGFNIGIQLRRRLERPDHLRLRLIAIGQTACDLIAVVALIHYTGGVNSFFIFMILLPALVSAELLPRPVAVAMAAATVAALNALLWGERQGWLPHVQLELQVSQRGVVDLALYRNTAHVLSVAAAASAAVLSLSLAVSSLANRLRRQARAALRLRQEADARREAPPPATAPADAASGHVQAFLLRKAIHEIRAPLAAMESLLEAAGRQGADAQQQHLLERARHRAQSLMTLVGDLLRYSRLTTPGQAPVMHRMDLAETTRPTVELFRPRAQAAGLELSAQLSPAPVSGDEELLTELVTNLLANAIQYTPAGGRVEVAVSAQGGEAVLSVADTGIGIREEERGSVFEEFYRSGKAKEVFPDGTGMGLTICRRIVELHGGRIEVQARPTGGTIFIVRFSS